MANSVLNKILSILQNMMRNSGNIFPGYEVSDADVSSTSGKCAAEYIYKPTIAGEETELRVVITATNIDSVFNEYLNLLESLSWENLKSAQALKLFEELTGIDLHAIPEFEDLIEEDTSEEDTSEDADLSYEEDTSTFDSIRINPKLNSISAAEDLPDIDISLKTIESNKSGLLGAPIDAKKEKLTKEEFGPWREFAVNKLEYNLMCETADDDAGTVSNQTLMKCVAWIHKYIDYIHKNHANSTDEKSGIDNQLSHEEKVKRNQNKEQQISSTNETDALNLVRSILVAIQQEMRGLYQDALNTDLSLDELIKQPDTNDNSSDAEQNSDNQDQQGEEAENPMEQQQTAAKHISVTLKKVTASDDLAIISLNSNYLPGETLNDIDEIINQNAFIDTLSEEPQTFDIEVDDDGFDIEKCEECPECDPCASLCEVFKSGIRAYRNLYILHWMSSGNDMMKLHNLSEEMYDELKDEIDTIGELLVEKQGTVPQLDFPCDYIPVQKYDFQPGLDQIKSLIQMYIDCIDYAYCNQDSDVQSTLDEWLRYWKKQLNYFVERQEV